MIVEGLVQNHVAEEDEKGPNEDKKKFFFLRLCTGTLQGIIYLFIKIAVTFD